MHFEMFKLINVSPMKSIANFDYLFILMVNIFEIAFSGCHNA